MDERYSRQVLFAPLGPAGQARLAAARVAIVGCGALGTAQADLLARAGVGRLRLIDRDYVEASNLQRQTLFDEEDARQGLPKAIAAQRRLRAVNSGVEVEAEVADVEPGNIEKLLAASDLLLDGTDNLETRYLLNDFAVSRGLPWIYGAAVGARGMTFTVLPGETACLECIFPAAGQGAGAPPAAIETCDTAGVLGWAVSWVAALQVAEAVKLLVGDRAALRDSLLSADLWRNEFRELARPARDQDCRCCGRHDYVHLRGEGRAAVTLCGRNAVQIHEHRRPLDLAELAARLRPHGLVRDNAFALRFVPTAPAGMEMMIFPDGRSLIKGTTEPGVARSLYARYVGN
ncbi:MAG TPA: ThiF family adenylyltransferase [Terriglobales bacterium]|nr:ThiF family adenylyltransferase [Terriglobales bacterium]